MTPGDRIDFDEHMAFWYAVGCTVSGVVGTIIWHPPLLLGAVLLLLLAALHLLDLVRVERRIKRQVREDMRRRG